MEKKPPFNAFFEEFVTELKVLLQEGFFYNGYIIRVKCRAFLCDTPARCYIKNVKGHNSYKGCDLCLVAGTYVNKRMFFLNSQAQLRSDASFLRGEYGDYHKGETPLKMLDIGLVSQFPCDYMHSLCLGVVQKLLFMWRDDSRLHRLQTDKLTILENRIKACKKYWPYEFNRSLRSLSELEHWKATEFRQFLLYFSPLLRDIL